MQSKAAMRAVVALLEEGIMADAWTQQNGEVRTAIPVEAPKGVMHSWFVPVTRGERLLGFFELTPELDVRRYSSFQSHEGDLDACPHLTEWVDPAKARDKVARYVGPGTTVGDPYLSFDTYPSRLAWAVPVTMADGTSRLVFVAGSVVFESP
jgi:hypothetical protein